MFSFGGSEFLIVVLVALLLFGPDKIPQLARTIGRFTREFNKYRNIMESTISAEIYRAEGPTKDTLTVSERIAKAGAASTAFTEARTAEAAAAASGGPADIASEIDEPVEQATPVEAAAPAVRRRAPVPSADEADEEDEG